MSALTYATNMYRKFARAQYVAWAVIAIAVAALFAIGFFVGRNSAAATMRDCSENSVDSDPGSGGGCGAITPTELIGDIQNNQPDDLKTIFADDRIGLPAGMYDNFAKHAQMGRLTRDGKLMDSDDNVVMTGVWTMGRTTLGGKQSTPIEIGGKTYYHSAPDASFGDGVESIPAMMLFDENGTVQAAVLGPCGNPVTKGEKVKSAAECKKLIKTPVKDKENTYSFTTEVKLAGLAKIIRVEYFADGEKFATEEKPDTPVTKTFTEDTIVVAKVVVSLPGKKKERVIESELCKQLVEVKKKEVPTPPAAQKPKPEQPKPQVQAAKVEQPQPQPVPAQPLPVTGPADAAALFFGTSLAGAIGHRLYMIYRGTRQR